MKLLYLPALLLLSCFSAVAQVNSNLVVFSEDDKAFIIRLNGVQSNPSPQTNVRIDGIPGSTYNMRIIFADTALGALNETIVLKAGYEQTYSIKPKKITAFEKKMKKVGNNIAWNLDAKDSTEMAQRRAQIENENSRYVVNFISSNSLTTAAQFSTAGAVSNTNPDRNENTGATQGSATQVETLTQSNVNGQNRNRGNNFSLNVNIGAGNPQPGFSEQTTVTTTTSQSNAGFVPGYNGPIGCNMPMNRNDFQSAKNSIQTKDFEQSKLTVAKQVFDHNCLLSSQVREIMMLFEFEQTRLDFAKYAYGRTYDIGNYYTVNDAFQFESSVDDLNRYVQSYR